jgi:hypothetical protein
MKIMKIKTTLLYLFLLVSFAQAQTRVRESEVVKYKGETVEVIGHIYILKTVNKDFALVKIGFNESSAKLIAYLQFKYASTAAHLFNREFGHFTGKVLIINNSPVLVINNLNHVLCFAPTDETVDSAAYYQKRREL